MLTVRVEWISFIVAMSGYKVEESNKISNTIGVNLEKFMFSIFLTLAIRNKLVCKKEKRKKNMYVRIMIF
jgi:hypothetical protein